MTPPKATKQNFGALSTGRFIALFVVTALAVAASSDIGLEWLQYNRARVVDGESWRIVTAQFVHLNANHLMLDLAAWVLIWAYGWHVCNNAIWLWLIATTAVLCGFAIHCLEPQVMWHGGLSGVLHGLFLSVAILKIYDDRLDWVSWVGLAALVAKVAWEQICDCSLGNTEELIALPVLTIAHAYGAASALAPCLVLLAWLRSRERKRAARAPHQA